MSPARDPQTRRQIASIAAHARHSYGDGKAATAAARYAANVQRFEDQVDPDRLLTPKERARRVAAARSAYFRKLALRSANVRKSATKRKAK